MGEVLIWIWGIFITGSLLVLERRCLGQRALVQPLALCLLAGWLMDDVASGMWVGVTLQLLSVTSGRYVDWALVGSVAAIAIVVASRLDMSIETGTLPASFLVLMSVLFGMGGRFIERFFSRVDAKVLMAHSPWTESHPDRAVERVVYRAVGRWAIIGGLEVLGGVALTVMGVMGAMVVKTTPPWLHVGAAVALPAFGVAMMVSALAEYRRMVISGLSMGLSMVVAWMVLA